MGTCPNCGGSKSSGNQGRKSASSGASKYAMGREYTGSSVVSAGTEGAIHKTEYGKTTLHKDGKHHHHGLHATNPKKGSFTSSDKLYSSNSQGLFGSFAAMFKRITK